MRVRHIDEPEKPVSTFRAVIMAVIIFGLGFTAGRYKEKQVQKKRTAAIPSVTKTAAVRPTELPTESVRITDAPRVIIPEDWVPFTDTDGQFNITATVSLPPGYSFRFTGSEWTIQNDSDPDELWDFKPDTSYDGSSRREWYKRKMEGMEGEITEVKEVPFNDTSYLQISVEEPDYSTSSVSVDTKIVHHYLYVTDGVANIITPLTDKAEEDNPVTLDIARIFASLDVSK